MAQRSNRRQPVYSADALALRYLGGLALVAVGVMMFLAVELRLAGNVFDALRQLCFGLTGGLAVLLPALPVWAGVLVIWSSQRKAPVKPFVYACLAFLALCAFIVTVTHIGQEEYLGMLSRTSDGSWGGVIHQGFQQSVTRKASGGALGIVLAYPFWSLVGTILSAIVLLGLVLLCALLALNLTPGRIRDLASGRISLRQGKSRPNQEVRDQQQIAFQQEQERQRQMAAHQQAMIVQQQQAQAAAARAQQNSAAWPRTQAAAQRWPEPVPGAVGMDPRQETEPQHVDQGLREWQQQLTDQMSVIKNRNRKSRIFDGGDAAQSETGSLEQPAEKRKSRIFDRQAAEAQDALNAGQAGEKRKSRIFDRTDSAAERPEAARSGGLFRRRNEDDGLSDLTPAEKREEGMAYPVTGRQRPAKPSRARLEQEQVEEDLNRWREPAKPAMPSEEEQTPPWKTGTEAPAEEAGRSRRPERPAAKPSSGEAGKLSPWQAQVQQAEEAALARGGETKDAAKQTGPESAGEKSRTEPPKPQQMVIPMGEATLKNPTWKPELKGVEPRETEKTEEYWEPTPYYAPPITDLKKPDAEVLDTSGEDEERSRLLEATLANFNVQARVVHVTHGPAISRFEMELAPGTKVNKISSLAQDIAYGMQATSVRIEAPIPGKSLVGVEVPNPKRATVSLREVLESPQMQNAKSILTVALGKDIAGVPIVCDLARMPHMLIAGATGSGKSVCINTIINSLLFRAGPDEVKMILVDPKVVELQCYNGIPHLLLPVVNDPHKAAAALAWAVAEMMERYDKFAERGVRNLEGYNAILDPGEKPMPRIVIIIDELADLMMVCKKDVEEYICRLTQLARAAGIHLIVATQRPSVDVITGLIKANIPSRIAFKTASYVDSRTILDRNGSEQLLGLGDMLYLPTGAFSPTRIQGCFLSDAEVNRIVDHVRQANPSSYDPDVLDKLEQLSRGQEEGPSMDVIGGMSDAGSGDADLFAQAVEYAIADGQISTSTLQRRLKIGYARAGRLTDELEERGIVSAKDGSKPRKCLITKEEWEAMKAAGQGTSA